jgi:Alkylmercury lyase
VRASGACLAVASRESGTLRAVPVRRDSVASDEYSLAKGGDGGPSRRGKIGLMDDHDLQLRRLTYQLFVDRGRAPTVGEIASAAGSTSSAVESGWRRLHDAHALVLNPATPELRMANPFSAVPTAYRVRARGQWWYANCAWDAFGVCASLHVDGRIETSCADCGEQLSVDVRDQRPSDERLLFHCLVPAAHWWDDIAFT